MLLDKLKKLKPSLLRKLEAVDETAQGAGKFIVQSTVGAAAKQMTRLGMDVASPFLGKNPNEAVYQPKGFAAFAMGDEPIRSFSGEVKERMKNPTVMGQEIGNGNLSKVASLGALAAGVVMDAGAGPDDVAGKGLTKLAKSKVPQQLMKNAKSTQQEATLVALHNLRGASLKFADEIGGLANPSVAIIDPTKTTFEGYGDISLLASKNLLFSGKAKTYGADVYSPRFPSTQTVATDWKRLESVKKKYGISEYIDEEDFYRSAQRSDSVKKAFEAQDSVKSFDDFVDSIAQEAGIEKRIFDGYTQSGKRRYIYPITAEKVSKAMNKEAQRSGESFFYGLGNIRAMIAPEFRSVEKIRKASNRLVSREDFEAVKTTYEDNLNELMEKVRPYYRYSQEGFGVFDDIGRAIGEYMGGRRSVLNEVFKDMPQGIRQELDEFAHRLSEMPTEYFETKFKRPVSIKEFSHAVIPDNTPEVVKQILEQRGVPYSTYRKGEAGSQTAAIKKAAFENGLMFGLGGFVFYKANEEK